MKFSTKSFKKLFLLGTVSVSIFGVVGCGNDSIKNTESDTKDNAKQVTKTDAQKNDELKEKSKETNDNTPYYKETNDDGIPVYMEEYEKIEVGISANKVKELIGKPSDIEKYKSYSLYRYGGWDSEGTMVIYFDTNGTVTKKEQNGLRYQPDDFERNYGVKREDVQAPTKKAEEKTPASVTDSEPTHSPVIEKLLGLEPGSQSKAVYSDEAKRIKIGMSYDEVTDILGTLPNIVEGYDTHGIEAAYKGYYSGLLVVEFNMQGEVAHIEDEGIQSKAEVESEKVNDKKYEKQREEESKKLQESYKESEQKRIEEYKKVPEGANHSNYDSTLPNGGMGVD